MFGTSTFKHNYNVPYSIVYADSLKFTRCLQFKKYRRLYGVIQQIKAAETKWNVQPKKLNEVHQKK